MENKKTYKSSFKFPGLGGVDFNLEVVFSLTNEEAKDLSLPHVHQQIGGRNY